MPYSASGSPGIHASRQRRLVSATSTAIPIANAIPKLVEQIEPSVSTQAAMSAAQRSAVEHDQRADAEAEREYPADLECPHRVLPAGPDEQDERGHERRQKGAHAVARVLEHQQSDDQAEADHQHPVRGVTVDPERSEHHPVDHERKHRQVPVVRR